MKKFTRTLLSMGLLALSATASAQDHVWKYVAAGDATSYAIRDDGTLWSCGWNEKGQMGVPSVSERTAEWSMVGEDTDWKKAVGGKAYGFFIKNDGSLWAVGTQESGIQGTGDGVDHKVPVQVGTDNDWADVTVGHFWGYSAIGLKTDGTIWGWGSNSSYQLGLDGVSSRTTPEQIGTDKDWKMVSIGSSHTIALKKDGTLWGWGQNYGGQLGTGDWENKTKPVQIGTDNDWVYVKAIDNRTYAIKADGTFWATGDNANNLLGFNQTADQLVSNYNVFTQVTTLPENIISLSGCEETLTMAVGTEGKITQIYALGSNKNGGLGDGNGVLYGGSSDEIPFSSTPVEPLLPEGLTYTMLASGQNYSFVLTDDGKLYGWGCNRGGQLGDGTDYDQLQLSYYKKPTEIPCPGGATPGGGDEDVVTVDASDIPTNLHSAVEIKLTGTWNTDKFAELAIALGTSGFGSSNSTLIKVDMSEALIEEGTSLYVQGSLTKNGAFVNCKALETVIMPAASEAANFTDLTNAFMNCEKLKSIDMQNCSGLTSLKSAFFGCAALTEVNISSATGLTGMSSMQSAFEDCTSLVKVTLPAEVTFASSTFGDCTALADIDWTRYAGTEAPIFYVDMFSGITDLKAITLTISEDVYDLFAAHANWSKLTLKVGTSTGIGNVETGSSVTFDGNTVYASQPVYAVGVYSMSGALVRNSDVVEGSWSVADIPSGVYVLTYTQNGAKKSVKIIKR